MNDILLFSTFHVKMSGLPYKMSYSIKDEMKIIETHTDAENMCRFCKNIHKNKNISENDKNNMKIFLVFSISIIVALNATHFIAQIINIPKINVHSKDDGYQRR